MKWEYLLFLEDIDEIIQQLKTERLSDNNP